MTRRTRSPIGLSQEKSTGAMLPFINLKAPIYSVMSAHKRTSVMESFIG
jgi:hypothetical protein